MAELNKIKGLALKIRATWLHLVVLRGVSAFWPALLLFGIFVALAFLGLFDRISPALAAFATLITLVGGAMLVWRGWQRFDMPDEQAARSALDRSSELRPIASLTDRPADVTLDGETLWSAHTRRLAKAARHLRLPWFGAIWRRIDPYYVRAVLPVFLVAGLLFAGGDGGNRLMRALTPDYGVLLGADDVRVEAWVTPPDYTRKPPVFLSTTVASADTDGVRVPAGSEVTLRAQARSAPKLRLKGQGRGRSQRFEATPDGAYEIKAIVTEDTVLTVNWWGRRAAWKLLASPDDTPTAEFVMVPSLGPNDEAEFTWKVADDYGVAQLELAMKLVTPHPAAPNEERRVPIELPGPLVKEAQEDAALDLTRHPWAGLMVEARLVATDGGGTEGMSAPYEFVLPEKLFLQSLARATQEVRVTVLREPRDYVDAWEINRLEVAPEGVQRAALMLEALTFEPYRFFGEYEPFLGLSTAHGMLKAARSLEEAARTDSLLWAIALKAEYGSSADALAALLAAKKALERALRDGASEDEIARLTNAFRQAAENYVQAKLAEAIANGMPEGAGDDTLDGQQAGGDGPSLGQNSFEDMLNALEDLTETGASDQARQLLSDITNMLENLEFQQGNGSGSDGFALPNEGGEGEEGEQSEEERELSESLEELAETLREQRELTDDTLEAQRGENSRARQGQQNGAPGSEGNDPQPGLSREELAERQARIGELLEQLGENGTGSGEEGEEEGGGGLGAEELADALRAQERAEDALRGGQYNRARRNQERVADALQNQATSLAEILDQIREGEDGEAGDVDPFGNPVGPPGSSDSIDVPDASERQRALDILEELRRRYGEATDPEEREYLERLLDRF